MYPATTVIGVRNSCTESDSRRGHLSSRGAFVMDALSSTGAVDVEGSESRFAVLYTAEEPARCGTVIARAGAGGPHDKGPNADKGHDRDPVQRHN